LVLSVPPGDGRAPLVRVFGQWNALLRHAAPGEVSPLLRVQRGAGLVHGARAPIVAALVAPLLEVAAPLLHGAAAGAAPRRGVRPKIRLSLALGGSGLLAELRYFGTPPPDAVLRSALAGLGTQALALPPQASGTAHGAEVCLRAVWNEAARRLPLVHLLAGRRELALPMFAVLRALALDTPEQVAVDTHSLAECLGEEPVPAASGRPSLLLLRRRGTPVALRVESLLGHGSERVLPVGPLLHGAPWLLGVIARAEQAPVLVIDPLALPALQPG
jgi:hypothetical protein